MFNVNIPMAVILTAIASVSLVAGMPFSPYFDPVLFWLGRLAGRALVGSPILFHATTIVIALATFLISAGPAFLLARRVGKGNPHLGIMLLGLAVAMLIAWPSLARVVGFAD